VGHGSKTKGLVTFWIDLVKPKFHYADFHQNFLAGKSPTQIMKVVDINHRYMSRCLR